MSLLPPPCVSVPRCQRLSLTRAVLVGHRWGGVPFYETSARKEINIQEVFEDVVRQMIKSGAGEPRAQEGRRPKQRKCLIL